METWSAHHLLQEAEQVLGKPAAENLRAYALHLRRSRLPVIFTLRHLSKIVGVDYSMLRATVERRRESANYRLFAIKKRSGGRRHIHAVTGELFRVQQFINEEILRHLTPHAASYAFHRGGGIRACASVHCGARWLFQYDLANFFHSINEVDVYDVFLKAGYRPLLSFELARLCTTTRLPKNVFQLLYTPPFPDLRRRYKFYQPRVHVKGFGEIECPETLGVLPQGASTSPMLSNLVAANLDHELTCFADKNGFLYTRYADDISFSAINDLPPGTSIGTIHREIIKIFRSNGFIENEKKIRISGPGSKKLVLGLLVDGSAPRISKETYKRIDRHLYASLKYGLIDTSRHENFDSPIGFYNHLAGLVAFVKDVDSMRWKEFSEKLTRISKQRLQ